MGEITSKEEPTESYLSKQEKWISGLDGTTGAFYANLAAKVNEERVRILVDTWTSSLYICSDLVTRVGLKQVKGKQCYIEQIYETVRKDVEILKITINSEVMDSL